ncbi:MAG: CaiB/BaiF CoA-transferase family protein [Bacteroidia bacterium]
MFQNVTIVELANVLAGPSVSMFFAELGARIIKVENLYTQGDVTRSWKLASEPTESDISAYYSSINWGKESIAVNLKSKEGQQLAHKIIAKADMVISSYLPGVSEKLGVDCETLHKINPRLIIGEVNGYGAEEPRPAYDAIIQAEAGFTYMNGNPGEAVKMPVALMDLMAGHQLKEAMLLAYIRFLQTGEGSRVTVSLLESGIASLANQATNWLVGGHIPQPTGSSHPNIVPYGTIFYTSDRKGIVLAVGNDQQFRGLMEVLGREEYDEFKTNSQRVKHRSRLNEWLQETIALWEREDLLEELHQARVPAGAVNTIPEVFQLPQAESLSLYDEETQLSGVRSIASKLPWKHQTNLSPPPRFHQHGKKILEELGYSVEEQKKLAERGVIPSSGVPD